jgi:hypothetical protein
MGMVAARRGGLARDTQRAARIMSSDRESVPSRIRKVYVRQREWKASKSRDARSEGNSEAEDLSGAAAEFVDGPSGSLPETRTATATIERAEPVVRIVKSFEVSSLRECISGISRQLRQTSSKPPSKHIESRFRVFGFGIAHIDT